MDKENKAISDTYVEFLTFRPSRSLRSEDVDGSNFGLKKFLKYGKTISFSKIKLSKFEPFNFLNLKDLKRPK